MAKSKRKRTPKTVLKLPNLEQSKSAVLNSLTSASSKRSYETAWRMVPLSRFFLRQLSEIPKMSFFQANGLEIVTFPIS
jgi:hypothetical protein